MSHDVTAPGQLIEHLFSLEGQLAVVTGASQGIGLAIASTLAAAGADIIGVSTSMPDGESAARAAVESAGRTFIPLRADFTDRVAVATLAADLAARPVDILVNNGGTIRRAPAAEHSDEDFDAVMDVNLRSAWVLSREIGAAMIERGHGKIVNTASMLSFQGGINVPGYTSSKSAIAGLTRALANEWASKGLNVNAVAPGYVATANTQQLREDTERSESILARIPAGRWAQAGDIAGAVLFLSSRAADYVNGAVLPVDGGWLAR
ncbi:2-deoxy-D-gluconate 3-dehydrogenase [Sanguibacter gelidistatuariae]|uniref:2-deoxy-D-gluconate 3-dehydrogenase n=1 Tax=Sanguibacter gelidistatuariae TaxID=1814289 RepID=A0A1G6V1E5_9MICO|nr:SDR family oxidoreductase [Sanguibacter gelidistatuariae]SDD47352.1 2-deoxy-D-gluconate 3-dehydrogenase [Sanguibacter gelidistatuariae]